MVRHLYVHIPFCHHICPYCAFYKHKPGSLANEVFVDALLSEAGMRADLADYDLQTIYFGGGTPSLLSRKLIEKLCRGLVEIFPSDNLIEWTIEANPATFDSAKAQLMTEVGITRASLGVQSFQQETLTVLGRDHSPDEARDAFHDLRNGGFENISVDLMFSIPGQTTAMWAADLECAIALNPEHLSCYNLTYEEDTEFLQRHESGELDANEDRDADLFYQAIDTLEQAGLTHYEISNYARPGFESNHNRAYWSGNDYLGLGPGAVSTIQNQRWKTLPDTANYISGIQDNQDVRRELETLTEADKRTEAIALQLRTREGIPTGLVPRPNPVDSLTQQGLLSEMDGRIRLTREGKALADPIAGMLV